MVKLLVRGPVGSKVFRVALSDQVKDFVKIAAESFHLDPNKTRLYLDHNFNTPINDSGHFLRANIPNINRNPVVYIKYSGELPKVETCSLTSYSNGADKIIGKDDNKTEEIKNFQAQWGDRAVGASFFEYKKRKLPVIDEQADSSCYKIRVGKEALRRFQAIAFNENFASHRITFLFGRINKITGTITVHCSCEPEQTNYPDHVEISPDFDISIPLLISDYFGMECVGIAISHAADLHYPMTQYMVQLAAYYQNFFSEYFTTLVVTPDPKDDSNVQMEAFQVTDAAMKLDQGQYFSPSDNPHEVNFTEEILNSVQNKRCKSCNVNILLTAVRIKQTESKFPSHEFPSPSQYPGPLDFVAYMNNKESFPTWMQLFDFNLLVYLVYNNIISENDVGSVVEAIIKMKDIPPRIMTQIDTFLKESSSK
ncbi:hypothetical protein M9Y10_013693 [Tritrichomonas musculus]|uniref:Uncharacterized protein n=1 Tax=Tritrichomonas musculus TaxID=1915356 RepID=A0ABR2KXH2_9EUKA